MTIPCPFMSECLPVAPPRFPQYDNPKGAAFKSDTSVWHPPRSDAKEAEMR
jgi:hypothetical protein